MLSTRKTIPELPEVPEAIVSNRTPLSLDDSDGHQPDNNPRSCALTNQLRSTNRLRRWYVTFGNPSLGTYGGSIVTLHPQGQIRQQVFAERGHESDVPSGGSDESSESESSGGSFSSYSSCGSLLRDDTPDFGQKGSQRIVVMVNVPPHQVPDGVLNLVRGHRPFIEHVRVVIGSSQLEREKYQEKEKSESIRRRRSQTWACEDAVDSRNLGNYQATSVSVSASISDVDEKNDLHSSKMEARISRSPSLNDSVHCSGDDNIDARSHINETTTEFEEEKYQAVDHHENENKNYHILFVLDSKESVENFVSDLHHRPYTSLDESETCSVYPVGFVKGEDGVSLLGPFFALSSTATPNDDMPPSSKDEHQCPVCLEKMIIPSQSSLTSASGVSSSIFTTVCNHSFHIDCLARWQDSPCPVCRYDHSGLNEALSRCHICATTVRNYVCLICGVISCAHGPSASTLSSLATSGGTETAPQAPSHLGHALQHYEESLHAYALDTETQHVWDFAGGGYVHRLLHNSEDGKIVEGTDPQLMDRVGSGLIQFDGSSSLSALERSPVPTYSSLAEDDEAIHRKLEGFAGQYHTLLKSQLEQQRIFYEGRLETIRREHENAAQDKRRSTSDLISALKQECNQLEQRCTTLRRKHKKVSDDSSFLENLNESLEADKHSFRRQISKAQAELTEAKQLTQRLLAPLEEKVSLLMLQLENGNIEDFIDDRKPSSSQGK